MTSKRDIGYDFIRFFALLSIILCHFYITLIEKGGQLPSFVKDIIIHGPACIGNVAAALFFILSGAVLLLTNKENTTLSFYKKRLIKIEIPQILGFIIAFWATYIVDKEILHSDILGILISALGLNYYDLPWQYLNINTIWVIGEWFTAVIIILYILFPILKYLFYKARIITTLCISLVFFLNLKFQILSGANGFFSITNGLMLFWLGMLFQEYKNKIYKHKCLLLSTATITLVALWIANPSKILGDSYLPCFIFSVLLFILLYQIKISNKFTNYICKFNYEIYLVHHRIYILFIPALLNSNSTYLQIILAFFLLTGFVFISSEFLQHLSNYVLEKLNCRSYSKN